MAKKNPSCPFCGASCREVVFGFPTPKTFERAARGLVVLGGCMVGDDEPAWLCTGPEEHAVYPDNLKSPDAPIVP
jgi:hypothetical protein